MCGYMMIQTSREVFNRSTARKVEFPENNVLQDRKSGIYLVQVEGMLSCSIIYYPVPEMLNFQSNLLVISSRSESWPTNW